MNDLTYFFTNWSIEESIVYIVALILAIKVVWSSIEWVWDKIKIRLAITNKKEKWENNISKQLTELHKAISNLEQQNQAIQKEEEKVNANLNVVQERLQEDTRSFLIDAHHKFCYQIKSIDDINMQSLERKYLYYKTAGGNSFIDGLMEEIRELPRINIYTQLEEDDRRA